MTKSSQYPLKDGRPYITSRDQIPTEFNSEDDETEFWELAHFAEGVLEEGPHIDAEVDRILGINRQEEAFDYLLTLLKTWRHIPKGSNPFHEQDLPVIHVQTDTSRSYEVVFLNVHIQTYPDPIKSAAQQLAGHHRARPEDVIAAHMLKIERKGHDPSGW